MRPPLLVVGLSATLALSACFSPMAATGPPPTARDSLEQEAAAGNWTDVVILVEERTATSSFVLAAYHQSMAFEIGGELVPAECWAHYHSFTEPQQGGGSGGGSSSCFPVGAPVDPTDWAFVSDDPMRITGRVAKGVTEVDVVFKDGTTQRVRTLSPGGRFNREVVSSVLDKPADQVRELKVVEAA